ncbi:MAG TPA: hypothetical protein VLH56_00360, partial [Dissulfurispiraceae bacterium]|nr:hypothetical protein [Dissulfurispiraceae bacterium]
DMIVLLQMFIKDFAIPKVLSMSKITRIFSQVSSYRLPLPFVKPAWSAPKCGASSRRIISGGSGLGSICSLRATLRECCDLLRQQSTLRRTAP